MVVLLSFPVTLNHTALNTLMLDLVLISSVEDAEWLHQAIAIISPIPRLIVHMETVEAARTVISVAIPYHIRATTLAGEVLNYTP